VKKPLHSIANQEATAAGRYINCQLDPMTPMPAQIPRQVQLANTGAQRLFGRPFAPHPVPAPANVLRLVIEPGPMRDKLRNWAAVVPALLDRAHREAIGGVLDRETAELVRDLRGRPDVARLLTEPDLSSGSSPIVDLHFDIAGTSLRFFSVVSTIGAPIDVTAQELRVEAFFPADDQTRDRWTSLEASERASSCLTTHTDAFAAT
jgi:MmyB-like transcription regulator ligand binding domain